jgi:hypothetical protein
MYSGSGSVKEITTHKHILHVFEFWLTQRNNNAQTHTPCVRVLTHTKKQQCTNAYSMYSGSGSVKETTTHKHILHVFEFWLTQRNNNAQTHTPCIRVLTHTKKQQCTNTYSMYSGSGSVKETTIHKHILHVFKFYLTQTQQYTSTYPMYSRSTSHKETTMYKHILHVFKF